MFMKLNMTDVLYSHAKDENIHVISTDLVKQ